VQPLTAVKGQWHKIKEETKEFFTLLINSYGEAFSLFSSSVLMSAFFR